MTTQTKKTKTTKIKQWAVEAQADRIQDAADQGWHLNQITDPRFRAAVQKELARRNHEAASESNGSNLISLIGRIERKTEKAILFVTAEKNASGHSQPAAGKNWWPKSQINYLERSYGSLDSIEAPAWLVDAKTA